MRESVYEKKIKRVKEEWIWGRENQWDKESKRVIEKEEIVYEKEEIVYEKEREIKKEREKSKRERKKERPRNRKR